MVWNCITSSFTLIPRMAAVIWLLNFSLMKITDDWGLFHLNVPHKGPNWFIQYLKCDMWHYCSLCVELRITTSVLPTTEFFFSQTALSIFYYIRVGCNYGSLFNTTLPGYVNDTKCNNHVNEVQLCASIGPRLLVFYWMFTKPSLPELLLLRLLKPVLLLVASLWWTRRPLSRSTAEGRKLLCAGHKSDFSTYTCECEICDIPTSLSQSWSNIRPTHVWCGNLNPPAQIHWQLTSQWKKRRIVSWNWQYP